MVLWKQRHKFRFVPFSARLMLNNGFFFFFQVCSGSISSGFNLGHFFTNAYIRNRLFIYINRIPPLLCSCIVSILKPTDCQIRYLGSSIRNLKIRKRHHNGLSYRSGRPSANPVFFFFFSEISEHSRDRNHDIHNRYLFALRYSGCSVFMNC